MAQSRGSVSMDSKWSILNYRHGPFSTREVAADKKPLLDLSHASFFLLTNYGHREPPAVGVRRCHICFCLGHLLDLSPVVLSMATPNVRLG